MEKNLKKMATMQRMRSAGLALFYKKGYYNTSIDDILRVLTLSKGAFYYHFKSKEEFLINIVENIVFQQTYSMLVAPIEGAEKPLLAIEKCLDNALETAEHNEMDSGFPLGNFINEFNGRNENVMKLLNEIVRVWEVNLIACLQKGKTDGYIDRHMDSEAITTYIMSSYFGIRLLMVDGNSKLLRYKYMQQLRAYLKIIVVKN